MARPNLTLKEAKELAHFGILMVPDVRMSSGWRLSVDGVPVASVPEPGTHLFSRAISLYRGWMSLQELRNPLYAPQQPRLAGHVWDDCSFKEVVAPHRVQAAADAIPATINADFAAFRHSAVRSSRVSGDRGGSNGRASEGDPDDMPELQEAIRGSEMVVSPQLVQDYIHIAHVAGHPEDPPNFPGYNSAIVDSIAFVVDVSSSDDDEDGGEPFGFEEEDLGGVDD
ncbi:hypothetical protein ZWY2020_032677 [Hordeum vulgare]|nr:hypothetical protein ZWY2020_032677 [Hordeum vulgare]